MRKDYNIVSNKIISPPHTHSSLFNNSSTNIIENNLDKLGIKTATLSSQRIRDLLHLVLNATSLLTPVFTVFLENIVDENI